MAHFFYIYLWLKKINIIGNSCQLCFQFARQFYVAQWCRDEIHQMDKQTSFDAAVEPPTDRLGKKNEKSSEKSSKKGTDKTGRKSSKVVSTTSGSRSKLKSVFNFLSHRNSPAT